MSRSSSSIGIPQIWSTAIRPYAVEQAMGCQYWHKVASIRPANQYAYWPNWEDAGTDVNDYSGNGDRATSTGLGLAVAGADGVHQTRAFNATPSHINILSAEFLAHYNPLEGTCLLWLKAAAAGQWTDGVGRIPVILKADNFNLIFFYRTVPNLNFEFWQYSGGVSNTIVWNDLNPGAEWFMLGLTWSKAANELKAYLNGAQKGATIPIGGAYVGALGVALLGAYDNVGGFPWLGYLAHTAFWNVALNASEVKQFSEV